MESIREVKLLGLIVLIGEFGYLLYCGVFKSFQRVLNGVNLTKFTLDQKLLLIKVRGLKFRYCFQYFLNYVLK